MKTYTPIPEGLRQATEDFNTPKFCPVCHRLTDEGPYVPGQCDCEVCPGCAEYGSCSCPLREWLEL